MGYAIVERELLGTMRTGRAFALQVATSIAFAVLIVSRWPGNATVELSGAQAREVFRLFAYGLLAILLLLVPAFPATSIVNERKRGTLALLLTSPLPAWSVYAGKALGTLLFASLLLALSVPAATAAYAMGAFHLPRRFFRCMRSSARCSCNTRRWPCWPAAAPIRRTQR